MFASWSRRLDRVNERNRKVSVSYTSVLELMDPIWERNGFVACRHSKDRGMWAISCCLKRAHKKVLRFLAENQPVQKHQNTKAQYKTKTTQRNALRTPEVREGIHSVRKALPYSGVSVLQLHRVWHHRCLSHVHLNGQIKHSFILSNTTNVEASCGL